MTRKVEIGAPSISGKDANNLIAEVFGSAQFPLQVIVQNHMPRDAVFPEVPGLFLKHVSAADGHTKEVRIASLDLFHRLASSIEQIASLNKYAKAVTISDVEADSDTASNASTGGSSSSAGTGMGDAGGVGTGDGSGTGNGTDGAKVVASEGLTYDQLKEALKAKGIEFKANTSKVDLAALLDAAPVVPDSGAGTGVGTGDGSGTDTATA